MTKLNCENCTLRHRDCFRSLSPDELEFVKALRRGQGELAAGGFLFREGEPPKALYTLHEGWVASLAPAADGSARMVGIFLPGDILGAPACITGRHARSVMALTRLRYCVLDRTLVERVSSQGGPFSVALLRELVVERLHQEQVVQHLWTQAPVQRLAYLFLDVFTRLKQIGIATDTMCPFPIARRLLAQLVGLSEVHFNRTLAEMRKDGLIDIDNNILYVRDEAQLADTAKLTPRFGRGQRLLL
jgi:CRP/FNR family transcriptional regulator